MRIGLVPYGTRGDNQPFLALAHELMVLGHEVRAFASRDFAPYFATLGVATEILDVDVSEMMRSDAAQRMLAAGDQAAFFTWLSEAERRFEAELHGCLIAVSQNSDLLLAHGLQEDRMAVLAAERRIPLVPVHTFPVTLTSVLPNPLVTARRLPFGWLNRLTYIFFYHAYWKSKAASIARLAATRGFSPPKRPFAAEIARRRLPTLTIHSPAIVPRPRDWTTNHIVTGHFRAAGVREILGESAPDDALRAFVEVGEPPVYLGFGSMPFPDPAIPLRWAEEIVSALSRRVVLVAGFTPLPRFGEIGESIFAARAVSHDWLMPRCCLAVHHGGAGTVQASLGAGVPTLVVSVFADQPFWGAQLTRLGVGSHIPFRQASGARIAAELRPLLRDRVRSRARVIGDAMAKENGARVAARFLQENTTSLSAPEPLTRLP